MHHLCEYFDIGYFPNLNHFASNFKGYEKFVRFHIGTLKFRHKYYLSYILLHLRIEKILQVP